MRRSRLACLAAACLFAFGAASSAAAPRWVQASPTGGSIVALAQAPSEPVVLYAYAQPGGLFVSADAGSTWHSRTLELNDYGPSLLVKSDDAQTVYAQTAGSLLRTRDGGGHWSVIRPASQTVSGIALDAGDSQALFAATKGGLYRSPDGGDTWELAAFPGAQVLAVASEPRGSAVLFAAIGIGDQNRPVTIWRSADHGASWAAGESLDPPPFGVPIPRFVFDPARPGTIYLLLLTDDDEVMFRSEDEGAAWSKLPAATGLLDLAASPGGTLFAATARGVARSDDGGDTWVRPEAPRDWIARVLVSTALDGGVFAAGNAGIWKSGARGRSWTASNQGIVALDAFSLAVAPSGPDTVYAVTSAGIFRSTDQGADWTRMRSLIDSPYPLAIQTFDPRHPRTMYGFATDGQNDSVVESVDGGGNWRNLPSPIACGVGDACGVGMDGLALDPANPDVVYVAGGYGFYHGPSGTFLWSSGDGFVTHRKLSSPSAEDLAGLFFAPGRHGALYAPTCRWLYASEDSGSSWHRVGKGLPQNLCSGAGWWGRMLAIDPRDPQRLYFGTGGQGVFVSSDGGATFRAMSRGLESAAVVMLLIDPKNPANLYASVATKGVFRWNAQARRWTPLNEGLPLPSFLGFFALDPQNPSILYAGTSDHGVFRIHLAD